MNHGTAGVKGITVFVGIAALVLGFVVVQPALAQIATSTPEETPIEPVDATTSPTELDQADATTTEPEVVATEPEDAGEATSS